MLRFLQRIFRFDSSSDLERFINSKNPQHPADVDYLMRVWAHKNQGGWL